MVVPLTIAEQHELAWREAKARRASQEEIDALELRWLETLQGVDSVLDFVPRTTSRWQRPDHLRSIAALFTRAESERVRALVSAPPRHSKTETIAHGIVWWLCRHPDKTAAYISYASDVSEEKSRIMRDIAGRAGLVLRKDSRKLSEWRTPAGGGLLAVGIDGPLTAKGVDLLVVDDPYKGRAAAESLVERAHVNDWLTGTAMTRLEPMASAIIAHARWHVADIIGVLSLLPNSNWEYINLPAINEDGSVLWPWRWPMEELLVRKNEIIEIGGEHDWDALYMGRPRIRGEQLFPGEPARYEKPDVVGAQILIACDPATGSGDNSAIVVLAGKLGDDNKPSIDVLDVRASRMEIPALVQELRGMQYQWQCPVAIEAVGGFKGVGQMLRSIGPDLRVTDVPALKSKYIRAQPVAAAWAEGRVRVPAPGAATFGPWVNPFITECTRFTGKDSDTDDRVDALAHGWNELVRKLRTRRTPIERFERLAQMG